jgi:hypothetical protein
MADPKHCFIKYHTFCKANNIKPCLGSSLYLYMTAFELRYVLGWKTKVKIINGEKVLYQYPKKYFNNEFSHIKHGLPENY